MSKEVSPHSAPPGTPPAGAAEVADVAVVIVNYGTADLALVAVESLLANPKRIAEIHLIDNASPGNDANRFASEIEARGWQGRVSLHAEKLNHGFGRGNNLVIDALMAQQPAGPGGVDKIFLLNPDAQVLGSAVAQLAEFLDRKPQAGAVGARISKPDESGALVPVTAAFRFPSLISTFSDAVCFGPVARLFARWQVPLPPETATQQVDWVSGAAVMFRRQALAESGPFDPNFFLYFEEVELMHRLGQTGWQTWFVAEAAALHAEGAATGVKNETVRRRRPAYWYDSWRYYMLKTQGRVGALGAAGLWLLGAAINHGISALRGRSPAAPLHFFSDFTTHAVRPLLRARTRQT